MSFNKGNIAFVDVETTGLNAETDHLLEIAVVITDAGLAIKAEFHAVVRYAPDEVAQMVLAASTTVKEMHHANGLWRKLWQSDAEPLAAIEKNLVEFLSLYGAPRTMPVGGNTVRLDMNFIDKHLPSVGAHLDYHMRDVSTVAGLASDWYDLPWFEKKSDHTAQVDVHESIRELKHYREAVFRNTAEDKALIRAFDVASRMPQGKMTDDQWRTFARLVNAVQATVTRVESGGALIEPLPVSETDADFSSWHAQGLANGWVGPSICIPHDGYPTSGPEDAEDAEDDCWHVLRLYPDAETKLAVEANHEPSVWRKP